MKNLKKLRLVNKENTLNGNAIDFISAGVGCNCLVVLNQTGILDLLLTQRSIKEKTIYNYGNTACVKSALITLRACGIIETTSGQYQLTRFGIEVVKYIGLITMVFDGYGDLIAHQKTIALDKDINSGKWVKGPVISKSANRLAQIMFDPLLIREFSKLKFSGTICDLGCGYGEMLSCVCNLTGNPGLGFDSELDVVKQARRHFKNTNITIEHRDITNLRGVWEDIVILMQCHVFHDFLPQERCTRLLNSFLNNFPNVKYFFFLDSVAPCEHREEILPGFDYVHGLLGRKMRTYEETMTMFEASSYVVSKEVPIDEMPSTFLWVLEPRIKKGGNALHSRS